LLENVPLVLKTVNKTLVLLTKVEIQKKLFVTPMVVPMDIFTLYLKWIVLQSALVNKQDVNLLEETKPTLLLPNLLNVDKMYLPLINLKELLLQDGKV
jgi:hypothetical protein